MVDNQKTYNLTLPGDTNRFQELNAGDFVSISGTIITARDAAHKRLTEMLNQGKYLPVDIKNQTIFYTGPTPTQPGKIIGSCGPTTSTRMDSFTPLLLQNGLKGMIGKGPRSQKVIQAMMETGGVYFYAFGGCGALYARKVKSMAILAFEDLGPEAIFEIQIKDFPVIVAIDNQGNSIFSSI